jgi:hypothetical protein
MTSYEIDDYREAGLKIHAVYEDSAGQILNGYFQGRSDAQMALSQAHELGFRSSVGECIYFACDIDIGPKTMVKVHDYFLGIKSVLHKSNVGVYGEADVLDSLYRAELATYRWQAAAKSWSNNRVAVCDMLQLPYQETVHKVAVDANEVFTDATGAWFPVELSAKNVWDEHPPETVTPAYRRLATMGETLAEGIPDQIGMVGTNVETVRMRVEVLEGILTLFSNDNARIERKINEDMNMIDALKIQVDDMRKDHIRSIFALQKSINSLATDVYTLTELIQNLRVEITKANNG